MYQPGTSPVHHPSRMPHPSQTPLAIPGHVAQMPMQLAGLAPLPPCFALEQVIMNNCFVVVQCFEPLEVFAGIETQNRYVIHDEFMRPILFAFEKSNFMARQCNATKHNFVMQILDIYGNHFMQSIRKYCCCSDNLYTEYPPGNQIGTMHMGPCSCAFTVRAAGCMTDFYIHPPCCKSGCRNLIFPIVTQTGFKVGEIVRLYPGYLQDTFTDADTFLVHFPPDMPPHLKLILLSAVFLIDFTYFEDGPKRN